MADAFSILPSDCWELIFNRIDDFEAISLVCKDFLSLSNSLQHHLNIYYPSIKFLSRFLKRFRYLKRIDLSDLHGADINQILLEVARSGLNLESLNVSDNNKSWIESLKELGTNMKSLKILECSNIINMMDSDLTTIASSLPCIEEINISDNISVSDDGIEMLTKRLPNLQKINLSVNRKLTERSLIALSSNCPILKKIRIHSCCDINQDFVCHLFRQCSNLVSFSGSSFQTSSSPSGFTIENSIAFATNLCELNFGYQPITNHILFAIASAHLPLKKFSLDTCKGGWSVLGLSALLRAHQSLIKLQIVEAKFLKDEDMSVLVKYLRNLTYINLDVCKGLTSSTLFNLLKSCPLLVSISMKNTGLGREFEINEELGTDLRINCRVQCLELSDNCYLNDELLKKIGLTCPNLEMLNVIGCRRVTNDGIAEALKPCNKITHLYGAESTKNFRTNLELFKSNMEVLKISDVDDEDMEMIAERCPNLWKLDVSYSDDLTNKGVMAVLENCVKLREIDLASCEKVSVDILPLMVSTRPSLLKICPPDYNFVPTEDQKDLFVLRCEYLIVIDSFGRKE